MSHYPTSTPPPLHHPVPQHPIQFQQPSDYGYRAPYGAGVAAGSAPGTAQGAGTAPFNNFFQDPSAQFGIEVGRNALNYGHEYIGKNVEKFVSVGMLRYYFQVSNSYVFKKVLLVLFPWRHKPWSRQFQRGDAGSADSFAFPRDDINAPDMYIPTVAFTSWLVLFSIGKGVAKQFHPQLLGLLASKSLAIVLMELMFLRVFTYLLAASSRLLDFIAYSGYKFIAVTIVTLATTFTSSRAVKWSVFLYCAAATSFFMLRSLRYDLLLETSSSPSTVSSNQRQRRIQFLFVYAVLMQFFLMWLLV